MSPASPGSDSPRRVPGRTWAEAAAEFAGRATRRARTEAFARPAALVLATAGALVLGARALRLVDRPASIAVVVAAAVLAVVLGVRAARRVPRTSDGTAAWALDRLAGARERGLTAATVGEAGVRSVDGTPVPPPPRVRLRPADGVVFVLGTALVPLAALLWAGPMPLAPKSRAGMGDARDGAPRAPAGGSASLDAGRKELEARVAEREAATETAIRQALGLAPRAPLDPADVAAHLADPAARKAAREAAPPGSAAAAALSTNDAGSAAALTRALESGAADRAEALRREAASLRSRAEPLPIPPSRRDVVARYLSSRVADARPPK